MNIKTLIETKEEKTLSCAEYLSMQVNREISNSLFYRMCQDWCDRNGFMNASAFYTKQSQEEFAHSALILDFMQSMDYDFSGYDIKPEKTEFKSLLEIIDSSLEAEVDNTKNLNIIKLHAIKDNSPLVEEFIRKMLIEQIEEETMFRDLKAVAKGLKEDDKLDMLHLDESFE